jgi:hypothetical protein
MANYYFVHQQKTGGTSLIGEIKNSGFYEIWDVPRIFSDFANIDPNANNFFCGHTHLSLKNLFSFEITPIIFLREPSKRIISLWNHTQSASFKPGWSFKEAFTHIIDADADTILTDPFFSFLSNNAITRKLAQEYDYSQLLASANTGDMDAFWEKYKNDLTDNYVPTADDLVKAKAVLDTAVIGLTEEYAESVNRIGTLMGFTPTGLHLQTADDTVTNVLIGREADINAANNLDYELWEYAKTLFESQRT